jgi:diadenosine tetraphosphate (Ap4A) HIT family hydrolase
MGPAANSCELCDAEGGEVLWRDARLRILAVPDAEYPGFTRVVWNAHVREMSDLPLQDRSRLMEVVLVVEEELRALLHPAKINLASLGNVVPHLHWHVIPRFADDTRFPRPIWAAALRVRDDAATDARRGALAPLRERLAARLSN